MQTLREMLSLIDKDVEALMLLKLLDKDQFLEIVDSEEIYEAVKKSKSGLIKISYLDGSNEQHGFTASFGEGIACRMSNEHEWYTTSTIKKIDWEDQTFETLNNIYKFEFQEVPIDEAHEAAKKFYEEITNKNDSKSKETR